MRNASAFASLALLALAVWLAPRTARADDILVYAQLDTLPPTLTGNAAPAEAEEILEGLGHTVTVIASLTPVLPADLSVFDTIWVIQLTPISAGDQTTLRNYVRAGGGLYLTGDNQGCCGTLNVSIYNLVNAFFMRPPPPNFAVLRTGGPIFTPGSADPFGITSTPNAIAQWETVATGGVFGAAPERVVFVDDTGQVGAVAYVPEDFQLAAGCIYVAMDLSFWLDDVAPTQDVSPLTENIERFLESCNDADHDGLSDGGETGYGTNPADPDTDDDGLCDGFGTVAGVCVAGERPDADFDMDGLINPRDDDDDGDGIPTRFELDAEGRGPDADSDSIAAYYDRDSDGDLRPDAEEGTGDYDGDGIPAIVDRDDRPTECKMDSECAAPLTCNLAVGYCHPPAGVVPDAGTPSADAGTATGTDAGPRVDAAGLDAGARPDGGVTSPPPSDEGGCGCHAAGQSTRREPIGIVGLGVLLALCAILRRRGR